MSLPECFCWTRFGTEAGQSPDQILVRKEQERIANRGVFFWGIGNAIGPSMLELIRRADAPEVVFSPIRSLPRREDAKPSSVVAWTEAETLSGEKYCLPPHSLITSRFDPLSPRVRHYALVCSSGSKIMARLGKEQIQFGKLRNILTGRPVGASQVTAVVYSIPAGSSQGMSYDVALRTLLAPPYFIILRRPVPLIPSADCPSWSEIVSQTWDRKAGVAGPEN